MAEESVYLSAGPSLREVEAATAAWAETNPGVAYTVDPSASEYGHEIAVDLQTLDAPTAAAAAEALAATLSTELNVTCELGSELEAADANAPATV